MADQPPAHVRKLAARVAGEQRPAPGFLHLGDRPREMGSTDAGGISILPQRSWPRLRKRSQERSY